MRLQRITVKGFMPFRDEQTLDLTDTNLFAIWGPTGSGKSSLLDAITFALYGKTPRWGDDPRRGVLVSLGAREARVELVFSKGREAYEVVRTISLDKQGRSGSEVEVRRWVDGQARGVTDGERWTGGGYDEKLEQVLGMRYPTFTHTLLLPQGQFDRFLKPDKPRDRKTMLIEIAGLGVYDQLFERAKVRLDGCDQDLGLVVARLGEHQNCSPERLQTLSQEQGTLEQVSEQEASRLATLVIEVEQAEQDYKLTQTLEALEAELFGLHAQEPAVAGYREQLRRAHLLAPLVTQRLELIRARTDLATQEKSLQEAQIAVTQAAAARSDLEESRAAARAAAAAIPALEEEQKGLTALLGPAAAHRALAEQVKVFGGKLADLEGKQVLCGAVLEDARVAVKAGETRANELSKDRNALPVDTERLTALQQASNLLGLLSKATAHRSETRARFDEGQGEVIRCEAALETASTKAAVKEAARDAARETLRLAEEALADLRQRHAAHSLLVGLQPGHDCPVCQQTVARVPEFSVPADLAEVEEARRRAGQDTETAEESHRRAKADVVKAEKALGEARVAQQGLVRQLEQAEADLETLWVQQETLLQWSERPEDPDAVVSAERQELEAAASRHKELSEALADLEKTVSGSRETLARETQRLAQLSEQHEEVSSELNTAQESLRQGAAHLRVQLGEVEDYAEEISRRSRDLTRRIGDLRTARERVEEEYRRAQGAERQAETVFGERGEATARLRLSVGRQKGSLQSSLQAQGLESEEDLALHSLSAADIADLQGRVSKHTDALAIAQAKQMDAERDRTRPVSQAEILEWRDRLGVARLAAKSRERRLLELSTEIAPLKQAAVAVKDLDDQRKALEARRKNFKTLHGLLSQTGLKEHVANALLDPVLELASSELARLSSGRYTLRMGKSDLVVLDAWNGNEERETKTLSGGETFLASLALALAMVEHLSGTTPLESLFIDEGFGTLDQDTLGVVVDTLVGLQDRGRLVGVISHVEELAEQLPVRIRVQKGVRGSCIVRD